jgi:pSer/pThr/pTyr-binding forkhead associated (FHA) protein
MVSGYPGDVVFVPYRLVAVHGPRAGSAIALGPLTCLGRDPGAQLVLTTPRASRKHAEIRIAGSDVSVTDLGSANGTRINGHRITHAGLRPGDVVEIGEEAFRLEEEAVVAIAVELVGIRGPLTGMRHPIGEAAPVVLGRGVDCSIVLQSQRASRRHVELRILPEGVGVRDLGSGNGTKVNGHRITSVLLRPGDVLEIGDEAFVVESAERRPSRSPLAASVVNDRDQVPPAPAVPTMPSPAPTGPAPFPSPPRITPLPSPVIATPVPSPAIATPVPSPAIATPQPSPARPSGIVCPSCQRVVDARFLDCPWDGTSLAAGRTVH